MPLKNGSSHEVVQSNVKELVRSGRPAKEAVAIALANKRKLKKMAEGGLVDSDFDAAGTPEAVDSGAEDPIVSSKPSASAPMTYREGNPVEDEHRSLVELDAVGDYHPEAVASPLMGAMQRMAAGGEVNPKLAKVPMKDRYAMGGLVDDPSDLHDSLGGKPSENMKDSVENSDASLSPSKADLEHAVLDESVVASPKPPKDLGLSEEAMQAIRNKRLKRGYPIA